MADVRLAVIGNCQAQGVATCLERLLPGADVTAFPVHAFTTDDQRRDTAERLLGFDVVFSQRLLAEKYGPLHVDRLQAALGERLVLYPHVAFRGFHPDMTNVVDAKGAMVKSPVWTYHSALALAAFLMGLDEDGAEALFNSYVFLKLGFHEERARSTEALARSNALHGYDSTLIYDDMRGEVFMHTPDHPTIRLLSRVAAAAAEMAGLDGGGDWTDEGLPDRLLVGAVLPVYPELATLLGVPGGRTFKRDDRFIAARMSPTLDLQAFIAESYAIYRRTDPTVLNTPRVREVRAVVEAL